MNILILSTHFNAGGITRYVLTLAKGLNERGHGVWVATSGGDSVGALEELSAEHLKINIRTKSELNPKVYFQIKTLKRFIKEKNIDVIHAQTRVTQVLAYFLSRQTGKPMVATCHGFFATRLARKLFPCWGKRTIAISPAVKNHLRQDFGIPESRIDLIVNGIDINQFPLVSDEERAKKRREFNITAGPVVGVIARLSDVKDHQTLILAFEQLLEEISQANLVIVGEGRMERKLKKLVDDLKMTERVRFYPVVNETANILPLFDLFAMPSRQEGLGLSVMEAQACGLPVVATNVGGLPSLIEHEKTGFLVMPGDVEALAKAIVILLKDAAKAKALGLSARAFIEKNFSAREMIEQTILCYQKALA